MSSTDGSNERLILFSDAIIAVTITLLALDIRLPASDTALSDAQLLDQIMAMWPRVFAYGLSFFVVGSFWVAHRRKFDRVRGSHTTITWLNFLFLLGLGLIPFATDVLAEHRGLVATVLYALVVALVSFLLAAIGIFADRHGLLNRDGEVDARDTGVLPSLGTAAVFLASIPVAFVDPDVAKLIWLALIPYNIWLGRRRGQQASLR